jgi:hypothetical protein
MLNRLLAKNVFHVRGSRDLFKKVAGGTTATPSSSPSPYRFGGIENYSVNEVGISTFAMDKKEEFIKIYGKLLDSIEHKDRKWLHELVEPQIVEPLLSIQNVKQVERDSAIELMFYNLSVGIGVTF